MGRIFLIGIGGFFGAISRYLIGGFVQDITRSISFPYGTLAVNVLGSFAIGFLYYFIENRGGLGPEARALVLIGMLGAFTTFSTFSLETFNLLLSAQTRLALVNLAANGVLGLAAVWAGSVLAALLWR